MEAVHSLMPEVKKDPEIVEDYFLIDLDRTLIDSGRLFKVLLVSIDMNGYGNVAEKLREIEEEKRGKSFNPLPELRQLLRDEAPRSDPSKQEALIRQEMSTIRGMFMELSAYARELDYNYENDGEDKGGFFLPGAKQLLESVRGKGMLFTYGPEEEWQLWKLEASGLKDRPHRIITGTDSDQQPITKSSCIHDMQDSEQGHFRVDTDDGNTIIAKRLIVVDDKYTNLENLPEGVQGYLYYPEWVERDESEEQRQRCRQFLEDNPNIIRLYTLEGVGVKN